MHCIPSLISLKDAECYNLLYFSMLSLFSMLSDVVDFLKLIILVICRKSIDLLNIY